jgi:hypothetical protein
MTVPLGDLANHKFSLPGDALPVLAKHPSPGYTAIRLTQGGRGDAY